MRFLSCDISVTNFMNPIPFFKPEVDEETIAAVAEVIRSGWLTTGPKSAEFEARFAEYVGAKYAVFVNSCTAALHLCLASIDLKPGDEVITTTYTFAATAEVIEYFDAKPVLVDIREDTMNIDESQIEERITDKTRAIIPVHFAGQPCEMDTIMAIAKRYGLYVFEDAAHCTPAYYKGKPIGSIGDATCFSFYANKCITTGEGGMITTDNEELAEKCRILRLHGLSKDASSRYESSGSWKYDIVARGYKYNPTDIAAVIGLGQLKRADEFWEERKRVVRAYSQSIPRAKFQVMKEPANCESSWHLFPARLNKGSERERDLLILKMKRCGLSVSVHFIPLHMHTFYAVKYGFVAVDFPCAADSYSRMISLPIYPGLPDQTVKFICQALV